MGTSAKVRSQNTSYRNDLEASPDASRFNSGNRHDLRSLSPEEKTIYHNWKCGVLIFYGAAVVVLGGLAVIGSSSTSIPALEKRGGSRAAGRGKQIADALDRLPGLLRGYCGPGKLLYDDDIRASDIRHREQHPVHFLWLAGTHLSSLRSSHSLAANQSD